MNYKYKTGQRTCCAACVARPDDAVLRYVSQAERILRQQVSRVGMDPAGGFVSVEVDGDALRHSGAVVLTGGGRVLRVNSHAEQRVLIVERHPLYARCTKHGISRNFWPANISLQGLKMSGRTSRPPLPFRALLSPTLSSLPFLYSSLPFP